MTQWQYKSLEFTIRLAEPQTGPQELDRILNAAGSQGWELIMLKELNRRPADPAGSGSGQDLTYLATFKKYREPLFGGGKQGRRIEIEE